MGPSSSPLKKKVTARQFLVHVHCGQTAGWIKMPLAMEVGLGSGDIVLDGTELLPPLQKGTAHNFWPMSIVAKWLDASVYHLVRKYALAQATLC